ALHREGGAARDVPVRHAVGAVGGVRPHPRVVRYPGKPTVVAYTPSDIDVFAQVNARAIACAGGTADDVLHVAYGYGLFTGGLGVHYGGERLGATVVPASGGNPGFQVQVLADLGASGLACTPSCAMLLAERAAADGLTDRIRLRYGGFGAEPWGG